MPLKKSAKLDKDKALKPWIWDAACSICGAKDGDFFTSDWLRTRNTAECPSIWKTVHNPNFKTLEFEGLRIEAGLTSYMLSVKEWVKKTNAIAIRQLHTLTVRTAKQLEGGGE